MSLDLPPFEGKRHRNPHGIGLGRVRGAAGMSHVMDNQLTILKRDARGRVRSTTEARAEAVVEYRRSGLSVSSFAKMAGISTSKNTFWNWLQCHGLTQKRGTSLSKSSSHQPVRLVQVTDPLTPRLRSTSRANSTKPLQKQFLCRSTRLKPNHSLLLPLHPRVLRLGPSRLLDLGLNHRLAPPPTAPDSHREVLPA